MEPTLTVLYTLFLVANLGSAEASEDVAAASLWQPEEWYVVDYELTLRDCAERAEELETAYTNVNTQAVCEPRYFGQGELTSDISHEDGTTPEKDY